MSKVKVDEIGSSNNELSFPDTTGDFSSCKSYRPPAGTTAERGEVAEKSGIRFDTDESSISISGVRKDWNDFAGKQNLQLNTVPKAGLRFLWDREQFSSNRADDGGRMFDFSGEHHTLTFSGGYLDDYGIRFQGSPNHVAGGNLGEGFEEFTICIWFYPFEVSNYRNPIDGNYAYNSNTGNVGPRLEMNSNGTTAWIVSSNTASNGGYDVYSVRTTGLESYAWHFAAIKKENGLISTYYNRNKVVSNQGNPGGTLTGMSNFALGRGFHLGGVERYFYGRIYMCSCHERPLSDDEIFGIYDGYKETLNPLS